MRRFANLEMVAIPKFRTKEYSLLGRANADKEGGVISKRKIEFVTVRCLEICNQSRNLVAALMRSQANGPTYVPGLSPSRPIVHDFGCPMMGIAPTAEFVYEFTSIQGEIGSTGQVLYSMEDFILPSCRCE